MGNDMKKQIEKHQKEQQRYAKQLKERQEKERAREKRAQASAAKARAEAKEKEKKAREREQARAEREREKEHERQQKELERQRREREQAFKARQLEYERQRKAAEKERLRQKKEAENACNKFIRSGNYLEAFKITVSYDFPNLYAYILKTAPEHYSKKIDTSLPELRNELCSEVAKFTSYIKQYSEGDDFFENLLKHFRLYNDREIKENLYICAFFYKIHNYCFDDAYRILKEGLDEEKIKNILKYQTNDFIKENKIEDAVALAYYVKDEEYIGYVKELAVKHFLANNQYEKAINLARDIPNKFNIESLIKKAIGYNIDNNNYEDALLLSKSLPELEASSFTIDITNKAIFYYSNINDFEKAILWARKKEDVNFIKSLTKVAVEYWILSQNEYKKGFSYAKDILTQEEISEICYKKTDILIKEKRSNEILNFLFYVEQIELKKALARRSTDSLIGKLQPDELLSFCRKTNQSELYEIALKRIKPNKLTLLYFVFIVYFSFWLYISTYASALEASIPILLVLFGFCFYAKDYTSFEKFSRYSYYFLCRIYPLLTVCLFIFSIIHFLVALLQICISVATFRFFAKIMPSEFTKQKYKK